jgi:hypothetical protein
MIRTSALSDAECALAVRLVLYRLFVLPYSSSFSLSHTVSRDRAAHVWRAAEGGFSGPVALTCRVVGRRPARVAVVVGFDSVLGDGRHEMQKDCECRV